VNVAEILEPYRCHCNVPDWREKTAYTYVNALGQHQRRWEFLRRLDYYRSAWDTGDFASDLDFGLRAMYSPFVRGDQLPADFKFIDCSITGTVLDFERFHAEREARKPDATFVQLAMEGGECNWLKDDKVREKAIIEAATPGLAEMVGERVLDLINAGYLLIPFDPAYPIKGQIASAKSAIMADKKVSGTKRRNSVRADGARENDDITLLRALDADNEYDLLQRQAEREGSGTSIPTKLVMAQNILSGRRYFGDTADENAAHAYFDHAVAEARRRATKPIFDNLS
jgi:hypothetical protein